MVAEEELTLLSICDDVFDVELVYAVGGSVGRSCRSETLGLCRYAKANIYLPTLRRAADRSLQFLLKSGIGQNGSLTE
jgi:hypothetical protein